ncbi:MAG: hypothetical protein IKU99_05485 [Clostridia bacterium]|nr:hypothetical protein [Clostridia bacterium]
MFFDKLFKKKPSYPENAKYKKGDFVNFRRRGDLSFGYIYEAFEGENGKITYTIQIGGQCPAMLYDWKEEDILGIKTI